jgi:anti-sigma factor RsiW
MKTCDKTNEQLAAFVLGYFSEQEVSEMTRHLVECEDCRLKVREHGKLLRESRFEADNQHSKHRENNHEE